MEIIIFIGIQGTGKSEFYKRYFYKTHMRINLDMLKTRNREKILVDACINAKQSFVIDNTNLTIDSRKKYIDLVKGKEIKIIGYYFKSSINEALKRNSERTGKDKVPNIAIYTSHKKLELPKLEEGFDKLNYVYINDENEFVVEDYKFEI